MYFRKISPRHTCLYSDASMCPRILSAAAQSCASNPRSPLLLPFLSFDFDVLLRAIGVPCVIPIVKPTTPDSMAKVITVTTTIQALHTDNASVENGNARNPHLNLHREYFAQNRERHQTHRIPATARPIGNTD